MNGIAQILVLAALLEAVVQTIKPIWEAEKRTTVFFANLGLGLALSIGATYLAGIDLFALLGVPLTRFPAAGVILTGVLLSRGANVVHDVWKVATGLKLKLEESGTRIDAEGDG